MSVTLTRRSSDGTLLVEAESTDQRVVFNGGPSTIYYGSASVSASSNDGSVTSGNSVTLSASKHLISAERSVLTISSVGEVAPGIIEDPTATDVFVVKNTTDGQTMLGTLTLPNGSSSAPALVVGDDPNTGWYRADGRIYFVEDGVVAFYVNSDGALIVPDTAAGDPLTLGANTAPGTIILGHNRALRAVNAARDAAVRLVTINNSDEIVLGSGGSEGGPPTTFVMRSTGAFQFVGAAAVIAIREITSASQTVLSFTQGTENVPRTAVLGNGRAEYSDGSASADVIVIPRNNAGEWRLAKGRILLNDTTDDGGSIEFLERTDVAAPGSNSVRIYAKDNGSGKTQLVARFPTGAVQQIAIEP